MSLRGVNGTRENGGLKRHPIPTVVAPACRAPTSAARWCESTRRRAPLNGEKHA
jgi:hypothetical protein